MFGFRSKKKENNEAKKPIIIEPENSTSNTGRIYQSAEKYGVKPEYFDYDKIELNPFLTGDNEYRNQLKQDDKFCSRKYGSVIQNDNCCMRKRFLSDLNAFDEINTDISNGIDANSFSSLSNARRTFYNSVDRNVADAKKQKEIQKFFRDHPEHLNSDHRGLFPEDYNNITNNFRRQAEILSKRTREMLLNEKTKVLTLDNIHDEDINTNLVRNRDTRFIIDVKDRHAINMKEYQKSIERTSPKMLMNRNYMRTLGTSRMINDQLIGNTPINEYNFDTVKRTEQLLSGQLRLKPEVPDVFEFMQKQEDLRKTQEEKDNTIDLDKLTPYNIVKPDIRIRKSEKRNIII